MLKKTMNIDYIDTGYWYLSGVYYICVNQPCVAMSFCVFRMKEFGGILCRFQGFHGQMQEFEILLNIAPSLGMSKWRVQHVLSRSQLSLVPLLRPVHTCIFIRYTINKTVKNAVSIKVIHYCINKFENWLGKKLCWTVQTGLV